MTVPARSRGRLLAIAAGLFVACALAALAMNLWQPLPERSTRGSETVDGSFDTVDIDVDRGALVVVGAAADGVVVDHESTWRGWQPTIEIEEEDGTATVVADCPWRPLVGSCSANLSVSVPEGVHLRVRSGLGSVELRDLSGWVEVSANGDLSAAELRSHELLARSGGHDVDVAFVEPPSRVDVDSRGGDVLITMPGGPYEADLSGDPISVEVPTEELAERLLIVDGGRGSVTIRLASAG